MFVFLFFYVILFFNNMSPFKMGINTTGTLNVVMRQHIPMASNECEKCSVRQMVLSPFQNMSTATQPKQL